MIELDSINPGHAIVTLYLIIAANFMVPLFSCKLQSALEESILLRHLTGFLTMVFFVRLTSTSKPTFLNLLSSSAIVYAWFLATTRMNLELWIVAALIAMSLFLIYIYETTIDQDKEKKTSIETLLPNIKRGLIQGLVVVTVIGVILYMGEKRLEYGKKFDLYTFIVGQTKCRHYTAKYTLEEKLAALAV
jgi:hypothetical protein